MCTSNLNEQTFQLKNLIKLQREYETKLKKIKPIKTFILTAITLVEPEFKPRFELHSNFK